LSDEVDWPGKGTLLGSGTWSRNMVRYGNMVLDIGWIKESELFFVVLIEL